MINVLQILEIGLKPETEADREKMMVALAAIVAEDSSFGVSPAKESGQTTVKGTSEVHLEAKLDLLKRVYHVQFHAGAPQVAYRETITRRSDIDYTHKKQTFGSGEYARVKLRFEPLPPGSGCEFKSEITGNSVPTEFIPGVEVGIRTAMENGVLAGFPVIDFKATLVDGAYHEVDSSTLTFEIATRAAFREGIMKAGPKLLEPIMKVEVVTPQDYLARLISDLNLRRGRVTGVEARDTNTVRVIIAMVPLANMFRYAAFLSSLSGKEASFDMKFGHYAPTPSPDDDDPFPPAVGMRA